MDLRNSAILVCLKSALVNCQACYRSGNKQCVTLEEARTICDQVISYGKYLID